MKLVLGLAFRDFALGGQFQFQMTQYWGLAFLMGLALYIVWKRGKDRFKW